MEWLHPENALLELALEDVFLVQGKWEGDSRRSVRVSPFDKGPGTIPVVAANMNAVSGRRSALSVALHGGMAVLPQDLSIENLERMIAWVKAADAGCAPAITVHPDEDIHTVRGLILKQAARMVVVIDAAGQPVGVLTEGDIAKVDNYDRVSQVLGLKSSNLVVVDAALTDEEADDLLLKERVEAAPFMRGGILRGVISRHDLAYRDLALPALDASGRLVVAATVGINGNPGARAHAAVEAGADLIVVDTAHGYQVKMEEAIRQVRSAVGSAIPLVAGNVCTAAGTRYLIEAGADTVKVNVGPGAMCTTRIMTGVGRPSLSAVRECAAAASELGGHVWADGGVKYPRDVALYLAVGAARVMVGTWFAGTFEAPGEIEIDPDGRMYKANYGMASRRAVARRNGKTVTPLELARRAFYEEGISSSKVYLKPEEDSVGAICAKIVAGLQSSMTYVGATDLRQFTDKAVVGVQTAAGYHEGTPHGAVRNK